MERTSLRVTRGGQEKLAARNPPIEEWEALEVGFNQHVILRNKRYRAASHRMVGRTDEGRLLTLLIRASREDDDVWDVMNGWEASKGEQTLYTRGTRKGEK